MSGDFYLSYRLQLSQSDYGAATCLDLSSEATATNAGTLALPYSKIEVASGYA